MLIIKILTAVGNEEFRKTLSSIENVEIQDKDIFYKDGILEFLEKNCDIDLIIINEKILEECLEDYLKKINDYDIKIFLITSKKHFMMEFDYINDIRLFSSEKEIIKILKSGNIYEEIIIDKKASDNRKVIAITGNYGVGKTVFCSLLGKYLAKNFRVLIMDFDIFNDSLSFLFDIKEKNNFYDIKSLIYKVQKNLYIFHGIEHIFNENNLINEDKVKVLIDELKKNYDFIIIDTSSEISLKYIKTVFPSVDYNIFMIEANSLELKKAKELLEVYIMDFGLELNKVGLYINKFNVGSIDYKIVENVFNGIKLLGKINYMPKINSYINTYTRNNIKIDDFTKLKKYFNRAIKNV